MYGGRTGWKRKVFFSHTYRSQYNVWWKDGVEKKGVPFAHVPEPSYCEDPTGVQVQYLMMRGLLLMCEVYTTSCCEDVMCTVCTR